MAKVYDSSQVIEAESNLRLVRLMSRINRITKKKPIKPNKDKVVAILGPTKGGKSTFINALLGTRLMCKRNKETEDIFILKAPTEVSGPTIGVCGQSETGEAEYYLLNVSDSIYAIWDFAGFGDNKGTGQELANAISYQTVLSSQKTVIFVLVAPYDLIKADNPYPFYELLNELEQMCPHIADSLCIVSTKADKGSAKGFLEKAMHSLVLNEENYKTDMIFRSKRIIETVLKQETYLDFKAPVLKEGVDEEPFTLPNKQQFVDCIEKLQGIKVTNFPLVVSETARKEIAELYTFFYQTVKREVDNMNSLIEKHIQNRIDDILTARNDDETETSAASRYALFLKGKRSITYIIERTTSFEEFFRQVKDAGLLVVQGFEELIEKFLFVEKLRNMMYKRKTTGNSTKGESEFINTVKKVLMNGERKYSNLILTSLAATKEEKRKEKEWQLEFDIAIKAMEEKIQTEAKYNDSLLVLGAKWLHDSDCFEILGDCIRLAKGNCVIS